MRSAAWEAVVAFWTYVHEIRSPPVLLAPNSAKMRYIYKHIKDLIFVRSFWMYPFFYKCISNYWFCYTVVWGLKNASVCVCVFVSSTWNTTSTSTSKYCWQSELKKINDYTAREDNLKTFKKVFKKRFSNHLWYFNDSLNKHYEPVLENIKHVFIKYNYLSWLFTVVPFKIDLKWFYIYSKWDDGE